MYRKIKKFISDYLKSNTKKILIIDGARQVGKSYIIRETGTELFENYIEINLLEDSLNNRYFENTKSTADFYLQLSMLAGNKLKEKENTLVFLDEIQAYPHLLTLLKFLNQENRFTYIASGSLLGITLSQTSSIPIGSIEVKHMYPMDFEEFLIANNFGEVAISSLKEKFTNRESLEENLHKNMLSLFKKYLLSGGLPDAVKTFIETNNIVSVRNIQNQIHEYYGMDASKYDFEHKLKIKRIFDMIPSSLENKKKRLIVQDIENKKGKRFSNYQDEFDYLINAGIALEVKAISTPVFPLDEHSGKNLLKLYLNDVGILSSILYANNIRAILDSEKNINLGTVYEAVVAQELKAHGKELFYYDNKAKGEVDYLINDYDSLSILPIEVKSGKDYYIHSALNTFLKNKDYNISKAIVLSNEGQIYTDENGITYLPIYFVMFL
ncbi:putative ATPase (AAA+ superfamily) [Treponema sp. JC4]|uniref:ATP-binding protein n=1 Tax=Treponema sp. JC4 TaxID=1124982 RepID=UPI00025B0724|nr:AAA family ATPase [Treponema sp. JC4]EID85239.1 putative ATPase (AAA+ superfamily) [Treponema sp. JC4]